MTIKEKEVLFDRLYAYAVEYAPDEEYLENSPGDKADYDYIMSLDGNNEESLQKVADFVEEWFPDQEEEPIQKNIRSLLNQAYRA